MADDEVDYSIIEKFGRAVGKEKITKNTPIFEAQTKESLALKNRLLTLPDPTIVRLPVLTMREPATTTITLDDAGSNNNIDLKFEQTIVGSEMIPAGVSDITFTVIVPDRFLRVANRAPVSKDLTATTRLAYYELTSTATEPSTNGAILTFKLKVRSTMDDTIWNIYGDQGNKNQLTTQISVIGDQSGIRKDVTVVITDVTIS